MKNVKKNGGFTLVELIVVIAILAILAAVAIPAYSGYIEKAEKANDLQLLGAVNTAFNAACVENGKSILDMEGAEFLLTGEDGNRTIVGLKLPNGASANKTMATAFTANDAQAILNSFALYYGENMNTPFSVFKRLIFTDGAFEGYETMIVNGAYNQILDKLLGTENAEKLQNLVNSVWGDVGAQGLTDKVDWTSDIAAEMLAGNPDGNFYDMITNCGPTMMEFMGITDPEKQAAKAQELAISKMNQLIAQNPEYAGLNAATVLDKMTNPDAESPSELEAQLFNDAQNAVSVNNAILSAAKNSQNAATNIKNILNSENPKSQLVASVNTGMANENTDAAMGEVALAYAMYMSYAERNNIEVNDVLDVLNGLNDSQFKNYVNNTDGSGNFDKDMQGYLASMEMINNSVQGNEAAVTDVVLNGFGNTDLIGVLDQAINSTKPSK